MITPSVLDCFLKGQRCHWFAKDLHRFSLLLRVNPLITVISELISLQHFAVTDVGLVGPYRRSGWMIERTKCFFGMVIWVVFTFTSLFYSFKYEGLLNKKTRSMLWAQPALSDTNRQKPDHSTMDRVNVLWWVSLTSTQVYARRKQL